VWNPSGRPEFTVWLGGPVRCEQPWLRCQWGTPAPRPLREPLLACVDVRAETVANLAVVLGPVIASRILNYILVLVHYILEFLQVFRRRLNFSLLYTRVVLRECILILERLIRLGQVFLFPRLQLVILFLSEGVARDSQIHERINQVLKGPLT